MWGSFAYTDGNGNYNGNGYSNAYFDGETYAYTTDTADTETSPHTGASAVTRRLPRFIPGLAEQFASPLPVSGRPSAESQGSFS